MFPLQQQRFLPSVACLLVVLALSMPLRTGAEVIELTPENIKQYIPHPDKNVFLYFYASWCGYCTSFSPEFSAAEEVFAAQSDKVIFAKGNADIHKSFKDFGVNGYPTINLYVAGKDISLRQTFSGERNKQGVINFLSSSLGIEVSPEAASIPKKPKTIIEALFVHDVPALLELIESGASVKEMKDGASAVVWAAELGHMDMVKILVENGADYSWDSACLIGDMERVEELIKKGENVNQKEQQYGTTCLMLAAEKNYHDLITLLIKHAADLDAENTNGNTALMKAAEFGMMNACQALVKGGASLSPRNKAGKTAHDVAVAEGKTEIAEYLSRNNFVHRVEPVRSEQVLDTDTHELPAHADPPGNKNEL